MAGRIILRSASDGTFYEAPSTGLTLQDSETGASANTVEAFRYTDTAWVAVKFTAGDTYTLTDLDLYLSRAAGVMSGNITAYIYSDNGSGNSPVSLIGTGSDTVDSSTIGSSEAAIRFTGLSASIVNGTTYWIVYTKSSLNATDYVVAHEISTGSNPGYMKDTDNAGSPDGTWSGHGYFVGKFATYSGG